MPTLVVVCDTNVYRQLGRTRYDALREREREHSVVAAAAYTVATELLSHVADEEDASYRPALAALGRLWDHTKTYNGSQYATNLIAVPHELLAMHVFGVTPTTTTEDDQAYGSTIGRIVNQPERWRRDVALVAGLRGLRTNVERWESDFVKQLWDLLSGLLPHASVWADFCRPSEPHKVLLDELDQGQWLVEAATLIVRSAAQELGLPQPTAQLPELCRRVTEVFRLPVHFWNLMIRQILERGVDMSAPHRRNSTWDMQVCFATGVGAALYKDAPVWLITGDGTIQKAANAAGMGWQVRSLEAYEHLLGVPHAKFRTEVAMKGPDGA